MKPNQEWQFTVVVNEDITDDLAEALVGAGCDDGTQCRRDGVWRITFTRKADSLEEAIRSAVADVLKGGATVKLVQIESDSPLLVGLTGETP